MEQAFPDRQGLAQIYDWHMKLGLPTDTKFVLTGVLNRKNALKCLENARQAEYCCFL